jgi:hypothetical protein
MASPDASKKNLNDQSESERLIGIKMREGVLSRENISNPINLFWQDFTKGNE